MSTTLSRWPAGPVSSEWRVFPDDRGGHRLQGTRESRACLKAVGWVLVAVGGVLGGEPTTDSFSLTQRVKAVSGSGNPERFERRERVIVERLFADTLSATPDSWHRLVDEWRSVGMHLQTLRLPREPATCLLLVENEGASYGRGCYAFRLGEAAPLLLQAPHSFFDLRTRDIVAKLFEESRARAACWNTVKRDRLDLAHTKVSYFSSFTQTFAKTLPRSLVVQFHGFRPSKRSSVAAASADIIVSTGTRFPEPWLAHTATQWRSALSDAHVRVFPWDTHELGGTTNAQGALLRAMAVGRFVHVECSPKWRKRLASDAGARQALLEGLPIPDIVDSLQLR